MSPYGTVQIEGTTHELEVNVLLIVYKQIIYWLSLTGSRLPLAAKSDSGCGRWSSCGQFASLQQPNI